MNRTNAFTIRILEKASDEFKLLRDELLTNNKAETVIKTVGSKTEIDKTTLQPNYLVNQVFWLKTPITRELFKYVGEFEVIHNGPTGLWFDDIPVTMWNYRTNISHDENVNYAYISYLKMTDIAPIQKEIEF